MDLGYDGRSLADGRGYTRGRAGSHVADREHARQAGLQGQGSGRLRVGRTQPGQDVALVVEREASVEPGRIGFGANEHENVAGGELRDCPQGIVADRCLLANASPTPPDVDALRSNP